MRRKGQPRFVAKDPLVLMAEGITPGRIDAALMAALQVLTDVEQVYGVGWVGLPGDLWERVDQVKRELEQLLQDRSRGHEAAFDSGPA